MKKKRPHVLHIFRIIISLGIFLFMLAMLFIPAGISGAKASGQTLLFKTQLIPSLIRIFSGAVAGGVLVVSIIVFFTFLFGRAYCSSLCPLGTLQDMVFRVSPRRKRNIFSSKKRWKKWVRYTLTAGIFLAAAFGFSFLLSLAEPYSIFTRLVADFIRPVAAKGGIAFSPVFQRMGIYSNIEPILFTLGGGLLGGGIAFGIVLVSFFKGRWFCNVLCPAGTVLSLPAGTALFAIEIDPGKCTACGACEKICKAGCINTGAKKIHHGDCVLCFSCLSVCPVDAISYRYVGLRKAGKEKPASVPTDGLQLLPRREFLSQAGKTALGLGIFLIAPFGLRNQAAAGGQSALDGFLSPDTNTNLPAVAVVPPGAGNISRFVSRCTACHLCIAKCPQQVLRPAAGEKGVHMLEKPVLDYNSSFCEFECNVCSQTCPTGALLPLSLEEKKVTKIGTASIETGRCVVYKDGTSCGACAEICPTTAVFMVPYEGTLTAPELSPGVCIGCGACERVCPVEGRKAIRVRGEEEHSRARKRDHLPGRAAGGGGGGDGQGRGLGNDRQEESSSDPFAF